MLGRRSNLPMISMRSNPSCGKFDRKIILFGHAIHKIPLAAASLAYAIQLFTVGQVGAGVGMVPVAALLVLITSMRLLMAFVSLRQQKMEDARNWAVNPKHLWPAAAGTGISCRGV